MKIYRYYGPYFDLFFGDGWKDWTRVRVFRGTIEVVGGIDRDLDLYRERILTRKNG